MIFCNIIKIRPYSNFLMTDLSEKAFITGFHAVENNGTQVFC